MSQSLKITQCPVYSETCRFVKEYKPHPASLQTFSFFLFFFIFSFFSWELSVQLVITGADGSLFWILNCCIFVNDWGVVLCKVEQWVGEEDEVIGMVGGETKREWVGGEDEENFWLYVAIFLKQVAWAIDMSLFPVNFCRHCPNQSNSLRELKVWYQTSGSKRLITYTTGGQKVWCLRCSQLAWLPWICSYWSNHGKESILSICLAYFGCCAIII